MSQPHRYRVDVARAPSRFLKRLRGEAKERLARALLSLRDEPRPPGCVALQGYRATYRIRVGDHRVVYEIEDDVLRVLVSRIGNRRDVYRGCEGCQKSEVRFRMSDAGRCAMKGRGCCGPAASDA